MSRYRIVKKTGLCGSYYIAQKKVLWWWVNLIGTLSGDLEKTKADLETEMNPIVCEIR